LAPWILFNSFYRSFKRTRLLAEPVALSRLVQVGPLY
jgi:hypothetical protein